MTHPGRFVAAALVALSALLLAAPAAVAVPTQNTEDQRTDMQKLKDLGYSCGRGGVGGYLCTKPNQPTFVCDNSGSCQQLHIFVRPTTRDRTGVPVPRSAPAP